MDDDRLDNDLIANNLGWEHPRSAADRAYVRDDLVSGRFASFHIPFSPFALFFFVLAIPLLVIVAIPFFLVTTLRFFSRRLSR